MREIRKNVYLLLVLRILRDFFEESSTWTVHGLVRGYNCGIQCCGNLPSEKKENNKAQALEI